MPFPSVLSSFPIPTASSRLNSPSHSALHNQVSSALGQVEAVIGVEGTNSVVGTLEYLIKSPGSSGGGHIQGAAFGGTGQTTFNQGDILVAQSASVLSKLAVSPTQGYALVVDNTQPVGIKWGVPNNAPNVRAYTTSSTLTWVKPSNLSYVVVEVMGGGGGGGGSGSSTSRVSGQGGGGGGYARKFIPASSILSNCIVIVGGAGTAGDSGANGSVGGVSSFSYTVSVLGNGGGGGGQNGASPGSGGTASNGDINFIGGNGFDGGVTAVGVAGAGGISYFGGGGTTVSSGSGGAGSPGTAYGSGGSGGMGTGSAQPGGAGAVGAVIVYEY